MTLIETIFQEIMRKFEKRNILAELYFDEYDQSINYNKLQNEIINLDTQIKQLMNELNFFQNLENVTNNQNDHIPNK